jgi:uncharacterized protein with beta-barrel porin domain
VSVKKSYVAAIAAAGLLGAGLSGCSVKSQTDSTPSASATNLQQQLSGSGVAPKSALGVTPKQQLEDTLLERLAAGGGQEPDTVDCVGDLQAQPGGTVECTIATDLAGQVYIVTVTTVEGDMVNFDYAPKP